MKNSVSAELDRIREKYDGVLPPEKVVDEAATVESPLHDYFDWEDTVAARKWRVEQARHLIRAHVTIVGDLSDGIKTRAYVSLSSDRGNGYRAIADVLSNDDMRAELLSDALKDMERFAQKYRVLGELAVVFKAMDYVRDRQEGPGSVAPGLAAIG